MGRKVKPQKRILSEEGWLIYCSDCDGYKPEYEFHTDNTRPFGKYYICKEHRQERIANLENEDKRVDMRRINKFFSKMGYDTSQPIHPQFLERVKDKYGVDIS